MATPPMGRIVSLAGAVAVLLLAASGYGQNTADMGGAPPRLVLEPTRIMCRGKEFDGMRGTLVVLENRARLVELPIIVVWLW